MYHTGIDPLTGQQVVVAKGLRDRKTQSARMQFFEPENYFEMLEALEQAGRQGLIGGCDALIPSVPPPETMKARSAETRSTRSRGQEGPEASPSPQAECTWSHQAQMS